MARHIGIDLGTSFTRIFMPGRGIILREPTAAAVDTENSELLTAGSEAAAMLGRTLGESRDLLPRPRRRHCTLRRCLRYAPEFLGKRFRQANPASGGFCCRSVGHHGGRTPRGGRGAI